MMCRLMTSKWKIGQEFVASPNRAIRRGLPHYQKRLEMGLAQNITITLCKKCGGNRAGRGGCFPLAETALPKWPRFGSRYHETWASGMTSLALTLNLSPRVTRTRVRFHLPLFLPPANWREIATANPPGVIEMR